MTERRWSFAVHDARQRTYRGTVTYTTNLDARISPPEPPARFSIVLLSAPARVRSAPERTAICVPGTPRVRPARAPVPAPSLPSKIADLWLPPRLMAAYRAGRIVTAAKRIASPEEVFPAHSDRPRLDRLALAVVAADAAETVAPYTALIRHELRLRAGTDALSALEARLTSADPRSRPPRRAPAVSRLKRTLQRLRQGIAPDLTFEQMTADLRFLALFDDAPMTRVALNRLLGDVRESARTSERARKPTRGRSPVAFRRREPT